MLSARPSRRSYDRPTVPIDDCLRRPLLVPRRRVRDGHHAAPCLRKGGLGGIDRPRHAFASTMSERLPYGYTGAAGDGTGSAWFHVRTYATLAHRSCRERPDGRAEADRSKPRRSASARGSLHKPRSLELARLRRFPAECRAQGPQADVRPSARQTVLGNSTSEESAEILSRTGPFALSDACSPASTSVASAVRALRSDRPVTRAASPRGISPRRSTSSGIAAASSASPSVCCT